MCREPARPQGPAVAPFPPAPRRPNHAIRSDGAKARTNGRMGSLRRPHLARIMRDCRMLLAAVPRDLVFERGPPVLVLDLPPLGWQRSGCCLRRSGRSQRAAVAGSSRAAHGATTRTSAAIQSRCGSETGRMPNWEAMWTTRCSTSCVASQRVSALRPRHSSPPAAPPHTGSAHSSSSTDSVGGPSRGASAAAADAMAERVPALLPRTLATRRLPPLHSWT